MRNKLRIPIVLELMLNEKTLLHFLNNPSQKIINDIYDNWEEVKKTWLKHPDLRFGQLLCNLRLILDVDIENHIWNIEEDNWLIANNYCKFENLTF